MTVLIVGDPDHYVELDWVAEEIEARGGEVIHVDPSLNNQSLASRVGEDTYTLGEQIPISELTGAFFEFHTAFSLDHSETLRKWYGEDPAKASHVRREHEAMYQGLLARLEATEGVSVVNPPRRQHWHNIRPAQLSLFREHNIPVPKTVVTNDPAEVEAFTDGREEVVWKPVDKGAAPRKATVGELLDELDGLENCPVMFQEYVSGRDVRMYVVGGEFVCSYAYDVDDWSFKIPSAEYEYHLHNTSQEQRAAIEKAVNMTGLKYAAVDLRERDSGDFTVLEVNADGRFAVPDRLFDGRPVSETLAEFLLGG